MCRCFQPADPLLEVMHAAERRVTKVAHLILCAVATLGVHGTPRHSRFQAVDQAQVRSHAGYNRRHRGAAG